FMPRYDPERAELSTRDRVALAAETEIRSGRGTPNGGVWLDVSHLPEEQILERLPRVYHLLLELQMRDITRDPIEVAPTAHYSMGGVWVRPEDHSTDVAGLYAIGEAASGLHGANRLGGNSLIELLVYGRITAQAAAAYADSLEAQPRAHEAERIASAEIDRVLSLQGHENVRALQRAVRNVMSRAAGVVRDEAGLRAGLEELDAIQGRVGDLGVHPDLAGHQDAVHAFDLFGMILSARATLDCALERRETRGCHNRSDFPELDEGPLANLVWSMDPITGNRTVEREPVPPVPEDIARQMRTDIPLEGKFVE
ncbi:FAD-binding protein, partial [Leucobacter sp. M11]|uniref:FAD-binding protein n=1 Tax=Leucobacter sp. M11 TaxID=2993565 RepID=UPI002D80CC2B